MLPRRTGRRGDSRGTARGAGLALARGEEGHGATATLVGPGPLAGALAPQVPFWGARWPRRRRRVLLHRFPLSYESVTLLRRQSDAMLVVLSRDSAAEPADGEPGAGLRNPLEGY